MRLIKSSGEQTPAEERRQLLRCAVALIFVALVALVFLWASSSHQVAKTTDSVAAVYLDSATRDELGRFDAIKIIPFLQSSYLRRDVMKAQAEGKSAEEQREIIRSVGEYQELSTCALLSADGSVQLLCGNEILSFSDEAFLLSSLQKLVDDPALDSYPVDGRGVTTSCLSLDSEGQEEELVLYCSALRVPMENGRESIGLIWGRKMQTLERMLNLENLEDESYVSFSLIDKTGRYLTHSSALDYENFFDRYEDCNKPLHMSKNDGAAAIRKALAAGKTYTLDVSFETGGQSERHSLMFLPVNGTDLWLIGTLTYSRLDALVVKSSQEQIMVSVITALLMGASVLVVFAVLLRGFRRRELALTHARERADRLSRRNEAAVHILHETLKSGMWGMRFDEQGHMTEVRWSDEFRHMIGYRDRNDFPDRLECWSDLLHEDDRERVIKEFNDTIKDYTGEKTYDVEYRLLTRDSGYRWFRAAGRLSRRADGTPEEYFGVFIDINERVLHEERLREALAAAENANRAKSEFLSNMSHDIRTPMNAIVGMSLIASEHLDDTERVKDCLHKITLSSKQLLGLINDVLDMSKIESGKLMINMEAVSLREITETICEIIRPQIKANEQFFDVNVGCILSERVFLDSVRTNQVLLNFLSNAMKYSEKGGHIQLKIWQEPSAHGDAHVATHFIIEDDGMGMSKEFQKKLFTAFEREDNLRVQKTQGTGLGLVIAKHIIDTLGGSISFESELGVGTSFHIVLNLEKAEADDAHMLLPGRRILLVDDNPEVCESAMEMIRALGAEADGCTSGREAVEKVRAGDYFAVLVDYRMPEMDGIETTRKIRRAVGEALPVLLVSAYESADFDEEARAAGVTDFVAKPLFKSTIYHSLLPFTPDHRQEQAHEAARIDLNGLHILLAEDQFINAEIMRAVLEDRGAIVDHAEDGQIAVNLFEASAPGSFDAILMDLRMPNMNGFEAAAAIRALKRRDAATIPILALTADAFAEDAAKCLQVGMNAHLTKPIDIDVLEKTLASFLKR